MKILNLSTTIHTHTLKLLWLCSTLLVGTSTFAQQNDSLRLLFVGDVMQHDGQIQSAYNASTKSYEYDDGFKFIKPIINQYDIKIANLEVTHGGKPYKGYPQFSAPESLSESLIDAGFNVILTANNHSCDKGTKGVIRTLDVLDELGVAHTGTFRNQQERDENYPLMISKNGMKIALLNYTYGTNGLTAAKPVIVNYIDSTVIKADIKKAQELNADYIVCNMHWGTEYKLLPNKYQKTYEQVCYRAGADMVIGGHPHVLQPIERKTINEKEKLTVWSLGNFVSNMKIRYTRGGTMVGATLKKQGDKIALTNAEDWLIYVLKKQEGAIRPYYLLPEFNYNHYQPNFVSGSEMAKMKEFFSDSRALYSEHNQNVSERTVSEQPQLVEEYSSLLSGYFSVRIQDDIPEKFNHELIKSQRFKTVDKAGNIHHLSGIFTSKEDAMGNYTFLKDCNVSNKIELVFVSPKNVTVVE